MALDGIFLHSISTELINKILNGKVEKVNQPEKDELVLTIKNNRTVYKLLISSSSIYPRMHFIDIIKKNPLTAPMFCMVLRKYLNNSKIVNISQLDTDRILTIDFESTDDMGFNSIYTLIIEIMGRHSNTTLVRKRDNIIMDSIKHITPDVNTIRCLYPGIEYIFPPKSNKLNPFNYSFKDMMDFVTTNNIAFDKNFASKLFTGIGKQFSNEIYFRILNKDLLFSIENLDKIYSFINNIFNEIKNNSFLFALYKNNIGAIDFYCIGLTNLEKCDLIKYESPSKLLEDFYYEKDKFDRLNSKSSNLQKLIHTNLDRCTKKIKILNKTLEECKSKDTYKIYGELLTANIYSIKPGDSEIEVLNYYDESGEYIKIKIDPNKSPSYNIQKYYKKYNKLKKSEEAAKIQICSTKEEINYLQSVLTNIYNAEDYESIEEIKNELMQTGYIRFKKEKKKKEKTSKPMHFISSDGIDLYVGKNNFQNDYLTLKFSNKNDIWMHTKNIPGSHVIIKNSGNISERTIEEAANLAAYYSKSKDSSKVPVDYTEVKNVHKPNGAKPGMVIYYTNKTIYITPVKPTLDKIK